MDEGKQLYFFVSRTSDVAMQLQQDDNVTISCTSDDRYVSVSGKAMIPDDMGKKEALWSPMGQGLVPGRPSRPRRWPRLPSPASPRKTSVRTRN